MVSSPKRLGQCQHSELAASKCAILYPHCQLLEPDVGACRLEACLIALEREHQKIDAFKRELPMCMQLLHDAIESCKEQLVLYRSSSQRQESVSCSLNDSDSVVQITCIEHEPVSKRRLSDPLSSNSNDGEQARFTQAIGNTFNWMKVWNTKAQEKNQCMISLEEASLWCPQEQASAWPAKPNLAVKKKPGGAFVPYNQLIQPIPRPGAIDPAILSLQCPDFDVTKVDAKFQECPMRPEKSSSGVGIALCTKTVSNSQQQLREAVRKEVDSSVSTSSNHALRKARRSWSLELHRLFVDALRKLGGAQDSRAYECRRAD